jgi:putative ABC transport system permease protein
MFDIQDDQIDQIESFLKDNGLTLQFKSPMVRGRIISVNDESYEREADSTTLRTREEEAEFRFRNRGVNMSYRAKLSSAEKVVEGRFFTGPWDPNSNEPFEVSVEKRYADRLGLKLNDVLKFDIQGIELTGKITSLRTVKWNSFQPNFFVLAQPGVLEEAPKIFLGAVPSMPTDQLTRLQDQLVAQFPNVSMVDVGRTVKRIFELSEKMTWSLELMAALSLLAGFVVLFSMAQHQIRSRRWDINMLKILGGDQKSTTLNVVSEFMMIGFMSAFFGAGLSVLVAYIVTQQIFDGQFQGSLFWPMFTVITVTALSGVISYVVSQRVVRERPGFLLHK